MLTTALLFALATACTDGDDPDDSGDFHGAPDVRGWPLDEAEREFARCPNIQLDLNPFDPADAGIERSLVVIRDQRVGLVEAAASAAPEAVQLAAMPGEGTSTTSDSATSATPGADASTTSGDGPMAPTEFGDGPMAPTESDPAPGADGPGTDTVTSDISDPSTAPPPQDACPSAALIVSLDLGVQVPQLIQLSVEESEDELARLGLYQRVVGPDNDDQSVLRQDPAAYEIVDLGSTVVVETVQATDSPTPDVSSAAGATLVEVPAVIGTDEDAACGLIRQAGLRCEVVDNRDRLADEGPSAVVDQVPAAGRRTSENGPVQIVVTRPPVTTVPNVMNFPGNTACERIEAAQLVCDTELVPPSGEPPGTVVSQDPLPGEQRLPGDRVLLVLHLVVEVPDVQQVPADEACAALGERTLQCQRTAVLADGPPGLVVSQSPAPGARLSAESPVQIEISRNETIWEKIRRWVWSIWGAIGGSAIVGGVIVYYLTEGRRRRHPEDDA